MSFAVFGTLILTCGSWVNIGSSSFHSIINQDFNVPAALLVFIWLFATYLVYVVYVDNFLLWSTKPWDRQVWNAVSFPADQVRDETIYQKQQEVEEIKKYKWILIDPT